MTAQADRHVVVVGLMGSGKSTVGRILARRLDRRFVDNDAALEARTGRTARAIAGREGAATLHRLEAASLIDALAQSPPAVVAAAASTIEEPDAVAAMRRHEVVYLRAAPDALAARVGARLNDDDHRPFVDHDPRKVFDGQFAARDPAYLDVAAVTVDTSVTDPEEIAAEIIAALAEDGPRTRPGS